MQGGKRAGAGRKPKPKETHKVIVPMTLDPDVAKYLRGKKNYSAFVNALIRQAMEATNESNDSQSNR